MPVLAENRKAYHDYTILETLEGGIRLTGPEVRSAKDSHIQITDSYIKINAANEAYLFNCYIAPYAQAHQPDYEPRSPRKLLLRSEEIKDLKAAIQGQNLTLVATKVYTIRRGLIKVEIALVKGKKRYEKKQKEQERDIKRYIDRTLKRYQSP